MEAKLRQVWSEVLKIDAEDINSEDNFFEVGGDSVASMKLVKTAAEHGIKLDAQTVFVHSKLNNLAAQLEKDQHAALLTSSPSGTMPPGSRHSTMADPLTQFDLVTDCLQQCNVYRTNVENVIPCTPFQAQLMKDVHELKAWTMQVVFETDPVGLLRLKGALQLLVDKNPIFRTRIVQHELKLYQVICKEDFWWHDCGEGLVQAKVSATSQRMMYGWPLSHFTAVAEQGRHYIIWTHAHPVFDRFSRLCYMEDLASYFISSGERNAQSQTRNPFQKFSSFVEKLDAEASVNFWNQKLTGKVPFDPFLPDELYRTRDFITTTQPLWEVRHWLPYMAAQVPLPVTFATVVHAAWALCIANITGSRDIFYSTYRSCRQMALDGIETVIGPLLTLVPFRIQLQPEQNILDLLKAIQEDTIKGIPHEPFGVKALQEHFGHRRYLQTALLIQPRLTGSPETLITCHDEKSGQQCFYRVAPEHGTSSNTPHGFLLRVTPIDERVEVDAAWDKRCIGRDRAEGWVKYMKAMLTKILVRPEELSEVTVGSLCPRLVDERS